jgi:hypothetical protein
MAEKKTDTRTYRVARDGVVVDGVEYAAGDEVDVAEADVRWLLRDGMIAPLETEG